MLINLLLNDDAIKYLKDLEIKAQDETLEVKGYIPGARWEWTNKYCDNLEIAAVMINDERTAEAVLKKNEDSGRYGISHIQIDLHSGKTRTSCYSTANDFNESTKAFESKFYSMIRYAI